MISSTPIGEACVNHGIELPVRTFSGAEAARVVGGRHTHVGEHSHDSPVLSLYVMGQYRKAYGEGEAWFDGPSVVLHGARRYHANQLGEAGLEQVDLQFDPAWLGSGPWGRLDRVHCWTGGKVAAAGRTLAALWLDSSVPEARLREATREFFRTAFGGHDPSRPQWVDHVLKRLDPETPPTAAELGRELGLHPGWLAHAYRAAMGEGLRETLRRRRVERASVLLRNERCGAADIAAAAGFCDQSHMNRAFRLLLGRTPLDVRAEGQLLRASAH